MNVSEWLLRRLAPALDLDAPSGRHALQALFGFGALLCFAGAGIRAWATSYLRSVVVHDGAVHTEGLVADGPFRHVRNPLYLGTQLVMCGMAFAASRLGAAFLVVSGLVFHLRLIGREEAALATAQGEAFRAYCARVPRFLPALAPRVASAGRAPRWGQGIAGEAFMGLFGVAMAIFAITLDSRSLMYGSGGAVILYFVVVGLMKRREATRGVR